MCVIFFVIGRGRGFFRLRQLWAVLRLIFLTCWFIHSRNFNFITRKKAIDFILLFMFVGRSKKVSGLYFVICVKLFSSSSSFFLFFYYHVPHFPIRFLHSSHIENKKCICWWRRSCWKTKPLFVRNLLHLLYSILFFSSHPVSANSFSLPGAILVLFST